MARVGVRKGVGNHRRAYPSISHCTFSSSPVYVPHSTYSMSYWLNRFSISSQMSPQTTRYPNSISQTTAESNHNGLFSKWALVRVLKRLFNISATPRFSVLIYFRVPIHPSIVGDNILQNLIPLKDLIPFLKLPRNTFISLDLWIHHRCSTWEIPEIVSEERKRAKKEQSGRDL